MKLRAGLSDHSLHQTHSTRQSTFKMGKARLPTLQTIVWSQQDSSELDTEKEKDPHPSPTSPSTSFAARNTNRTIPETFAQVARSFSQKPAIATAHRQFPYGRLLQAAWNVAESLLELPDFDQGARVVLLAHNSPEYVAGFHGILLAGGVVVPLPPDIEERRLQSIVDSCHPICLTTTPSILHRRQNLPQSRVIRLTIPHEEAVPLSQISPKAKKETDLAALFYTSGSSGEPKGVMLSHRNLLANARSICSYLKIDERERPLALLPFYHAFGNSVLQTHILSGATLILDGSLLFPESILDAVEKHRATSLSGVPDLFRLLIKRTTLSHKKIKTLHSMTVAGGAFPPQLAAEMAQRIEPARFFVMYGQTEATARLSYLPPEKLPSRWGSIGRGIPGVELQVVDENDHPVPSGKVGEIRARGENIMLGYWRDPQTTGRVLRNGWLYTGDQGTVDEDGYIYLQGRQTDIVKIAGYRVHPSEVEQAILQQFQPLAAVAVPYQHPQTGGTRLALFVQTSKENENLSAEEVARFCSQTFPRYKIPHPVEIVNEFPLNNALKIDRQSLMQRASQQAAQSLHRQDDSLSPHTSHSHNQRGTP